MLDQITPVILTYNEAPNIERTLGRVRWARDIVVVDSFSTDETLDLIVKFPQTRVFQRRFDCHDNQWNFALRETGIASEWVLALDSDYLLTAELIEELKSLEPATDVAGYRAKFVYCINGRALRGSAYPPVTVLYRRERARYRRDGHTQQVIVEGQVEELQSKILHDDRKSFDDWLRSQKRYMKLETQKLRETRWCDLGWPDRIRKLRVIAPIAMPLYCLFVMRVIFDGRPGLYYAFQRMLSELLLSLYLFKGDRDAQRAKREGQGARQRVVQTRINTTSRD